MKAGYLLPFALVPALASCGGRAGLPNVVLINMDDMGYGDLGITGAQGYQTPNIDRLSMEGMRFTQFYAPSAVSSASRAGLLTGCYPNRISIYGALRPNAGIGIDSSEVLIPHILRKKGYATAIVGKWHVGSEREFLPLQRGFDEFYGLPYSNDMWPWGLTVKPGEVPTERVTKHPDLPLYRGNEVEKYIQTMDDQDLLTENYTSYAVDFIKRNRHRPFFLYFAHSMVHVPLPVSDKFRGKSELGIYGDAMMEVDWSVGEVLAALKDAGLEKNTLVIFTSDNGPWMNFGDHAGGADGLRDGKFSTYEGGIRVPCIMKWPGHIPEGVICNRMADAIDILPTLAEIVGGELPEHKIDGVSILPLMEGDNSYHAHDYLYYYIHNNRLNAVRNDRFKLVEPHKHATYDGVIPHNDGTGAKTAHVEETEWALYDLRRDPGERYNVIELYPEVVEQLKAALQSMREEVGDSNMGVEGREVRPAGRVSDSRD